MTDASLNCLGPLDGRYADKLKPLASIFSEHGLFRARLAVEVRWFMHLSRMKNIPELPELSKNAARFLQDILDHFSVDDSAEIKAHEHTTNHDVKAVEYFLKSRFDKCDELKPYKEFIHFACTSEDINNLAYGLMIRQAINDEILPMLETALETLIKGAEQYANAAMLSRTHGQTASPTTMGKEWANVAYRLARQLKQLKNAEVLGKINGAVGNYNAHLAAYPNVDWQDVAQNFVQSLGLNWNPYTIQIEPHDYIAEISHTMQRIDTIMIDFSRDIWGYISLGYFKQRTIAGEVGSSTMPHKVNPIDFENAEGNFGLANALFSFMAEKLPISRWQRDLTDSTVLRNTGLGFGYAHLAQQSLLKGIGKLELNQSALDKDLDSSWEVLAEPIQTVMRQHGHANPYEQMKELTRGKGATPETLSQFIATLDIPDESRKTLADMRPDNYIGNAEAQVKALQGLIKQLRES